jgi:alginate O-acetyltransferase complex protein AlgJ
MARTSRIRGVGDVAVIAAFAVMTSLPTLLVRAEAADSGREGRALAEMPAWPESVAGWTAWPAKFEKWFDDHFGGRDQLLCLNTRIATGVFGVLPTDQVVLGTDGWLYFTKSGIFADRRGEERIGEDELERWRTALETRSAWLTQREIAYAFLVLPNKATVYGDNLPWRHRHRPARPTRMDQIAAHLAAHSTFALVDTRAAMIAAGNAERVYHATDSHWNDLGAYVGYRAILDGWCTAGLAIEPVPLADFEKRVAPRRGDLVPLIPFLQIADEDAWSLVPRTARSARRVELPAAWKSPPPNWGIWQETVVYESAAGTGTLLCAGDSFMWSLIPFLAEHFQRCVFVSAGIADTAVLQAMVEVAQPTAILEQRVERNMKWAPLRGLGSASGR